MTAQNYCMVNEATNTCENVCLWDGDPNSWTPTSGYMMLPQDTTPSKVWALNETTNEWELTAQQGGGQIGFAWDGAYLVTNQPKPEASTN